MTLKALTKVCYKRIDNFCEKERLYRETQAAFRRHRSRRDKIFIVRLIQTSFQEKNIEFPKVMAFIDTMKAHDCVQSICYGKFLGKLGYPQILGEFEYFPQYMKQLKQKLNWQGKPLNHSKSWLDFYKVTATQQFCSIPFLELS